MTTLPWFGALLSARRELCLSTVFRASPIGTSNDVTSRRGVFYNVFAGVWM